MTPPQPHLPRTGRSGQLLASVLRIQSLVSLIVGGTLALGFALGGQFGRVALSLGLLAYGLGALAYATRVTVGASPASAGPRPPARALSASGRVIPIAGARRTEPRPAPDELDQLAGR